MPTRDDPARLAGTARNDQADRGIVGKVSGMSAVAHR